MSDWNPEKYLQFKKQRTQPAIDLAKRIDGSRINSIIDIGCGPGNSTAVLSKIFKDVPLKGIDVSESMLQAAQEKHPDLTFELGSATELTESADLLFSNACLQWIPDHETLIPFLMEHVNEGGCLAVQVPRNQEEPLFRLIRELAAEPMWNLQDVYFEHNDVLAPEAYFDILSQCAREFDIWETVYYHAMPSHEDMIDWVRSSRLRPYLDALSPDYRPVFEAELLERAKKIYPFTASGEVILKFRRLFFIARK